VTVNIGREGGEGPAAHLGAYRALDGSHSAAVHLDVDGPHAGLVVGKRGSGKSNTLGVLAEGLARTPGVAPVVVDPMGALRTLAAEASGAPAPAHVLEAPTVPASSLDPRSWCALLGLAPDSGAGALVWQAATEAATLSGMREWLATAAAPAADTRAARNHLALAASWEVFDPDGLDAAALAGPEATVIDVSGLDRAPANAVVRGVAASLYRARVEATLDRLPWLLVDEAHAFFDGVANAALRRLLTRGRAPGVSLVCATQRPSALPAVGVSQADLLVAHRLTSTADLDALRAARPSYLDRSLSERLPEATGAALVVDDATESVHTIQVRERETPHGGPDPRASAVTEK
jgi:DNA helicase HerA-like ATPase